MQTTFKSLVVALTLVSGMAMADEAAPAAVAPADGQPGPPTHPQCIDFK